MKLAFKAKTLSSHHFPGPTFLRERARRRVPRLRSGRGPGAETVAAGLAAAGAVRAEREAVAGGTRGREEREKDGKGGQERGGTCSRAPREWPPAALGSLPGAPSAVPAPGSARPSERGVRKRGETSAVQASDWDWSPGRPELWEGRKRTREAPRALARGRPPPRLLAGEWPPLRPCPRAPGAPEGQPAGARPLCGPRGAPWSGPAGRRRLLTPVSTGAEREFTQELRGQGRRGWHRWGGRG